MTWPHFMTRTGPHCHGCGSPLAGRPVIDREHPRASHRRRESRRVKRRIRRTGRLGPRDDDLRLEVLVIEELDDAKSLELMETFLDAGHVELDTALAYSGGETEKIMGRIFEADPSLMERCTVATKANPWPGGNMTSSAGEGGLAPSELRAQVEASRASLSPYGPIDLLYLHAPDAATEIDETLAELKAMHDEGAFVNLGLSNFPAWEVVYIHGKCAEIGLPPPTTYQGMYNCLTRAVEPELIPALRKLNMRFLAYNPLAGGLLTGKHRGKMNHRAADDANANALHAGRFTENEMYRDRFWNERYFAAVDTVRRARPGAWLPRRLRCAGCTVTAAWTARMRRRRHPRSELGGASGGQLGGRGKGGERRGASGVGAGSDRGGVRGVRAGGAAVLARSLVHRRRAMIRSNITERFHETVRRGAATPRRVFRSLAFGG